MRKKVIWVFLSLLLSYTALVMGFFFMQEKLLFFPGTKPFKDCDWGVPFESESYRAHHLRTRNSGDHPQRTLLFFHGNAGTACDRGNTAKELQRFFSDIYFFEYPGYAGSTQSPSQESILRSVEEFSRNILEKNSSSSVYLMGESLGSSVAVYASTLIENEGLILLSPFTNLAAIGKLHYGWLPIRYLLRHPFPSDEWILASKAKKVLILHGDRDETIPIRFGQELSKRAGARSFFQKFSERGHNDLLIANPSLWSAMEVFVSGVAVQ